MDEVDVKIVELLRQDGKKTLRELKEALGISEPAIQKRINKLVKEGVIKRYTIEVDEKKVGYGVSSFLGIDIEPEALVDVQAKVKEFSEIKELYLTTGDHSLMAYVECKDQNEFSELISKKLIPINGVRKVYPSIILERVK
ncbi:MAG: Lrp/AsnC family transcriptional regulator [Thaumarchaeota archaeon]|jgi:Lrp/AsnC family transcriptional regulator for asnA, asnC and gidA|nr:Lrp/AsnC family transcriptional regulator [Nitrososphaerota archaeon]